eukprot:s4530_g9.t1
MMADGPFMAYSSGVYTHSCDMSPNHAVTAIGWEPDSWICLNSWGPNWGGLVRFDARQHPDDEHGRHQRAYGFPLAGSTETPAPGLNPAARYPSVDGAINAMTAVTINRGCKCSDTCATKSWDPDPVPWCFVQDSVCQGTNWGYCEYQDAGCIMSRNYEGSNKYRDREECEFDVKDEPSMEVLDFQVEGYEYDYLEVNGEKYSGDNTPHGKVPKGKIEWSSDYSVTHYGWKICPKPVPAPAPDAEKYTTKDCLCKHGWRYWGVDVEGHCGNPDNDPNGDWCRVEDRGCQGIGGTPRTVTIP